MTKYTKLIERIRAGASDSDIGFDDLRQLLVRLGFEQRIHGSLHIFRKAGVEERLNLQRDGEDAKSYQVRQVRYVILKYRFQERA